MSEKIFGSCPNCKNETSYDSIRQCKECQKIFCSACSYATGGKCPECNNQGTTFYKWYLDLGRIK